MSNFTIYLIGIIFVVCGLALAAFKLAVSPIWIITGVIILCGIGIIAAVLKTRMKEKS
jgi:Flp pilus assembly protein TadB